MKQIVYVTTLILLQCLFPLQAQGVRLPFAETHWVNNLSMSDGLSHNYIDDIFRDSYGFIWIATSGSLARYDGYEFINFSPNMPTRYVRSALVRKVAEDRFGRLWVASDGGVDVIDLKTLATVTPDDGTKTLSRIQDIPSGYVSSDNKGNIWLRTVTDIIYLEFDDSGKVVKSDSLPHESQSVITTFAVKPVVEKDPGVWTSINGRVCRLTPENGKIRKEEVGFIPVFPRDAYISDYMEYDGKIWIATELGLYRVDLASGEVREYHAGPDGSYELSQNYVTAFAVTQEGLFVVGSLNGFNIYDSASDRFHHLKASDISSSVSGLGNNFVNCMLAVDDGLWVGTEGCGIDMIFPKGLSAMLIRHEPSDARSISPNPVNAIFEDGDGTLWVGTVEGGLNRSFSRDYGFDHFTVQSGALTHNSVSAITADHEGHLWVGTWGGGICVLPRSNPARSVLTFTTSADGKGRVDYVGTLLYDPINNYVWVGANTGLFIYDFYSRELRTAFPGAEKIKGSVASVVSSDGKLWIGGPEGLFTIDLKRKHGEKEFKNESRPFKFDNPDSRAREKVTSIALASDGAIWIGTNGNGIYRRDVVDGKERFVNYNTSDGLPNDVVHGIAEDLHGNLWIATYHGLSCLKDGMFLNYGSHNGLGTEQFYWNATCRLLNGDIFFGSVDGLLLVGGLPDEHIEGKYPVVFTSVTTAGGIEYCSGGGVHEIHEREKSFEVRFSSLDYTRGAQGRYFYRMNGFDGEWKELPAGRHSVTYTNLSPGSYVLEVKYLAPGQTLDYAAASEFKIRVVPYFYKEWWFLLLAAVAFLAAVWAVYRWRVGDLTRQRNALKSAVENGVREISMQKNLIEANAVELSKQNEELKRSNKLVTEKNKEINNQNDELRKRNEEIGRQKTKLAELAHTVHKMTVDRISFFTNITHEFRTPITLIIGPVERALKLSTNPKVIEQLNYVERNSKYLLSLVNQLMDFRKVESGKIEVVPNRGNFRKFIDELVPPFRAFAEERNITLSTLCHLPSPVFLYDEDALRKVITNLLGNAIKFTPDNGRVTLYVALFKSGRCENQNTLYISVSDTGCGIREDEIDKVFDRYYQGKSQMKYPLIGSSDSGIGLYLCRHIVEVYGGKILVRNNKGAGCSFRVLVGVPEEYVEPIPQASSDCRLRQSDDGRQAPGLPAAGREPATVLVVEDNHDMRAFMRSILSDYYSVIEAENGEEALKILLARNVDFIISDLMMPVMDGIELSRQVKGNFAISHIPFLMLTAKTSKEARLEGFRTGIDEYLQKPFDEEMLLTRIQNILDNKRRYQNQFIDSMEADRLNISNDTADKKFVDKVMEVVRANYQNSYFEVGDFAEALGVSRSLLNKKLSSLLGESPNQFIRTYRLKIARELIIRNRTTHTMNVSEIAFEVGFNDSKYFTRCFTKQYGVSPSSMLKDEG